MNIVSYRGPGKAGGVSSTLCNIWNKRSPSQRSWWYLEDSCLLKKTSESRFAFRAADIPQELVDGHYRYCNKFLWPVMHDLPEHAQYSSHERQAYKQLNWMLAKGIGGVSSWDRNCYFLQDYQFAMMPKLLDKAFRMRTIIFWHIPWPASVTQIHLPAIVEVADSLLRADAIGFHTQEYADNFRDFVSEQLPQHYGLLESGAVELVVAPLGIDTDSWAKLSQRPHDIHTDRRFASLTEKQFILSIDRADYTKGVADRLRAIDRFFELYPQHVGKLTFVQICGRTRPGLPSFDKYWQQCEQQAGLLNSRWSRGSWAPLLWITDPVTPDNLALLYRDAAVMLVNPVRDGLNLTAKEFAACQGENPAALLLSRGAGAWHELGLYAKEVEPGSVEKFARAIQEALTMSKAERERAILMRAALERNSLLDWWGKFVEVEQRRERELAISRQWSAGSSTDFRSLMKI